MNEKKWFDHWTDWAYRASLMSKDPSTKVGAVLIRPDNTLCSTGYNGFPRKVKDYDERLLDRTWKYPLTIHAEINAILFAKEDLTDYSLYVHGLVPCSNCAAVIAQSGISNVFAVSKQSFTGRNWNDELKFTNVIFEESNVNFQIFKKDPS